MLLSARARVPARAPAPDLARGLMLLSIALAHSCLLLYAVDGVRALGLGDRVTVFLEDVFVNHRARPMFVLLFGYGLAQLALRCRGRGESWDAVRRLVRRRGLWLLLLGLLHVMLLFYDVLTMYGIASLILAGALTWSDARLLQVLRLALAGVAMAFAVYGALSATEGFTLVIGADSPIFTPWDRVLEWLRMATFMTWQVLPGVLLGIWAARRRILEEPHRHRTLLTRTAALGLGVSVLGGVPFALMEAGFWQGPTAVVAGVAAVVHGVTGYAGGVGAAALIGLAALRVPVPAHPVVVAVQALGQRSLTFYLFQSVAFVGLMAPFALGLGGEVRYVGAAGIAFGTWLVSLAGAYWLHRAGHRGPAEVLLRRLSG
ncbi:DUF418 domain-containing protein [Myceligenerans pegani]|uniref:DUF418 domain-containing protein n=1 Tax=Myceligenerans pegani TaxID=2776917 RepID=A0ABR9N1U0_9MICO|nr:DUF418 domain-containing protein [Myceligenerans sp. TRM 65318]MBE1877620.1 DUF418 domain-containing protein [Myceligenerans sp. TRM 65318]MBE3019891.1 DUF418 domain-containing protein [Myceligenerans sp. TRM 65318]